MSQHTLAQDRAVRRHDIPSVGIVVSSLIAVFDGHVERIDSGRGLLYLDRDNIGFSGCPSSSDPSAHTIATSIRDNTLFVMTRPASICVFCGSGMGDNPVFRRLAHELGTMIAEADRRLIYGGGHVGLMGVVADAVLAGGGAVTGIIPGHLRGAEVEHTGVTDLIEVDDMFERKRLMVERSDAFVALPGGLGTIDEILDVITLAQLGQHSKPMVILDAEGYWQPFRTLLEHTIACGYARAGIRGLYEIVTDLDGVSRVLDLKS